MKHFNLDRMSKKPHIEWPDNPPGDSQLFLGRQRLRKLVVMCDADVLPETSRPNSEEMTAGQQLKSLLSLPLIKRFLFAGGSLPAEVTPSKTVGKTPLHEDWVVLDPGSNEGNWCAVHPTENGYKLSAVRGNAPTIAANDSSTGAYDDLPPEDAARRRHDDALACQVAGQGLGADLYITNRPYLLRREGFLRAGTTVCTVDEALGLIGLYLRVQGDFQLWKGISFDRGLFYWVGTRDILSQAWRWHSACVQHSHAVGDEALMLLGGSLLQRFDRALEQRDQVLVSLSQPQDNDLRDDALHGLDVILVYFMAAFDVAARVAHRTLQISHDEFNVGWQKKGRPRQPGWWDKLDEKEPQLAAVVARGTTGHALLTVVRLLRNSVHGAALQGLAYVNSRQPQQTLVGLPADQEANLLAAMDQLGGRASWGASSVLPGRTHVDPATMLDRLFECVPALLNELMKKTPVERLQGVRLTPDDELSRRVEDPLSDPFSPLLSACVRRLLGL